MAMFGGFGSGNNTGQGTGFGGFGGGSNTGGGRSLSFHYRNPSIRVLDCEKEQDKQQRGSRRMRSASAGPIVNPNVSSLLFRLWHFW